MMEALPPLDALRCFAEAARLLNFRAAARSVGLTPAALGQRIRQLEDHVGTRLFHRTTRSVVLTQAGLDLLPYVKRALDAAHDCVRAGRGELGPAPMELTVGTRHELGLSWLVPLLPRLRAAQPGLTLHLYFGSGLDLVLRVRTLEIDCAVTSSRLTDPKLDSTRLHQESYLLVAQPRLLERHPFKRPEDAAQHTLIDATGELPLYRYWRDAPGGFDSLEFRQVLRMGTISAIRALVLRGDGVAVLPEYYVAADVAARRLTVLMPRIKPLVDNFRLVFRADDPRRSIYQALAQAMLQEPLR